MSTNDGGPAFPIPQRDGERWDGGYPDGMTLRDWFAGQALASVLGNASVGESTPAQRKAVFGEVAKILYGMADAMLAERERDT